MRSSGGRVSVLAPMRWRRVTPAVPGLRASPPGCGRLSPSAPASTGRALQRAPDRAVRVPESFRGGCSFGAGRGGCPTDLSRATVAAQP
ncbi:hypothetical protein DVS28_a3024 [Euzebya pacifica]|uniref:Uncharacterized protein n=1 Tax=Euzebya pacifica TaxID=1608957 RepID=A0A346XZQ6_9ACTN|nr:hypothetical protein DVS28_a3024 [Euzebya pacifica]